MLLLTILILFVLALINYRIGGKSLFHPATAFCLLWAVDLFLVWLVGDYFYPISSETLLFFLVGAVVFSTGCLVAYLWPMHAVRKPEMASASYSNRVINLLIIAVICATPLAFHWIATRAADQPGSNFFIHVVRAMTDEDLEGGAGNSLFGNTVQIATLITLFALWEIKKGKKRFGLVLALAVGLQLLTAARSGITALTFALLCLDWLKNRRIRWKALIATAMVFLVLMSFVAMMVGKADADPNASVADNVVPVIYGLVLYASGGLVALDHVITQPNSVPFSWHIYRPFTSLLNRLGVRLPVERLHAEFVNVGPEGLTQNVYTFYFEYLEFGYAGTMAIVFILGFVSSLCYRQAVAGSTFYALIYSLLFAGVMVTIFNEGFFGNVSNLVKLAVLYVVIYRVRPFWDRFMRFARGIVGTELSTPQPRGGRALNF